MIYIKTKEQIDKIRESCHMLRDLLDELENYIKPGLMSIEVDSYIYNWIKKRGYVSAFLHYQGFPGSACISINEEVIHGIPSKRVIKSGDLVKIDCGINYDGYISDSARTYLMPGVSDEHKRLSDVTKECLYKGIDVLSKANVRVSDISRAVYNHATRAGFGVLRDYAGHGVGLHLHEDPEIPNYITSYANARLRENMIIAIEPMITYKSPNYEVIDDWTVRTLDGGYTAHWEHTVLVKKNDFEILT